MSTLQKRALSLIVDTLDLSNLDAEFESEHDLTTTPNQLRVTVYNLSKSHREQLTAKSLEEKGIIVELKAGYEYENKIELKRIFLGQLRTCSHVKTGTDWVTTVSSGTGDDLAKMVSLSVGAQASFLDIVDKLKGELNLVTAETEVGSKLKTRLPGGGRSIQGPRGQELQRLLNEHGLGYSVQNDSIQILSENGTTKETRFQLSIVNGMVGSPEISATKTLIDEATNLKRLQRTIKVKSFLNPDLYPGRQLEVFSEALPGDNPPIFKITKVTNTGSTFSQEWYSEVEAKEILDLDR